MIYEIGHQYYVRAMQDTDLAGPYRSWFEDQDVCRYSSHGKFSQTDANLKEFYNSIGSSENVLWAICHPDDGHIGNVGLRNFSFVNRRAEFGILLGDRRHWGKGVGNLAGRQIFKHGFEKLNLARIYCGTAATNKSMQKLAIALDMREEGLRRNHLWLDGEWVDVIEYGVLRSEWFESTEA